MEALVRGWSLVPEALDPSPFGSTWHSTQGYLHDPGRTLEAFALDRALPAGGLLSQLTPWLRSLMSESILALGKRSNRSRSHEALAARLASQLSDSPRKDRKARLIIERVKRVIQAHLSPNQGLMQSLLARLQTLYQARRIGLRLLRPEGHLVGQVAQLLQCKALPLPQKETSDVVAAVVKSSIAQLHSRKASPDERARVAAAVLADFPILGDLADPECVRDLMQMVQTHQRAPESMQPEPLPASPTIRPKLERKVRAEFVHNVAPDDSIDTLMAALTISSNLRPTDSQGQIPPHAENIQTVRAALVEHAAAVANEAVGKLMRFGGDDDAQMRAWAILALLKSADDSIAAWLDDLEFVTRFGFFQSREAKEWARMVRVMERQFSYDQMLERLPDIQKLDRLIGYVPPEQADPDRSVQSKRARRLNRIVTRKGGAVPSDLANQAHELRGVLSRQHCFAMMIRDCLKSALAVQFLEHAKGVSAEYACLVRPLAGWAQDYC